MRHGLQRGSWSRRGIVVRDRYRKPESCAAVMISGTIRRAQADDSMLGLLCGDWADLRAWQEHRRRLHRVVHTENKWASPLYNQSWHPCKHCSCCAISNHPHVGCSGVKKTSCQRNLRLRAGLLIVKNKESDDIQIAKDRVYVSLFSLIHYL